MKFLNIWRKIGVQPIKVTRNTDAIVYTDDGKYLITNIKYIGGVPIGFNASKITNEKENNVMKGTVKWFDNKKGYGFITTDDGNDYFVHYSKINTKGFKYLLEAQEVMFRIEEVDGKKQAINVKPIRKKKGDKNDKMHNV